jgi:hypothetical protein
MDNHKDKDINDIRKIVIDLTRDILLTFPEQKETLNNNLAALLEDTDDTGDAIRFVYAHCKKIYPERFFDILYQNNDIFNNSIEFLPGMDFAVLWADKGLSDKSRETIWKYLQLLLFTLVSTISDGSSFGDTAKLFEAIDEKEFKKKLEETIAQMQNVFTGDGAGPEEAGEAGAGPGPGQSANGAASETGSAGASDPHINLDDLPDPKDIHDHVTGMMNGKLGSLAREIAEETAAELNMDMENAGSVNDVFKTLFKNPTKLMGLVKSVGTKLDSKLKSGDMKESELLQEASDIMQKMKSMPGMGDLQSMLSKMGMGHMMPGGKGGGKVNMTAMQANLDRNLKAAKNKERLLATLEKKKAARAENTLGNSKGTYGKSTYGSNTNLHSAGTDAAGRETLIFSKGEPAERSTPSSVTSPSITSPSTTSPSKKKKNKHKKSKQTTENLEETPVTI